MRKTTNWKRKFLSVAINLSIFVNEISKIRENMLILLMDYLVDLTNQQQASDNLAESHWRVDILPAIRL